MVYNHDYRRFPILYVDDESQALKYFRKALEKDFEILTAGDVPEAREVLREHRGEIGILVCDQRMPGETGTELLSEVRKDQPGIIRVLTTAYSDLDSAIEAVNSGAIYKYIVKPWDVRDLRGVLLRAMDFFIVQRQRDALLKEKLSVLQRMMVSDRIRSLAVLATGLSSHIRHSMTALKEYLDMMPDVMRAPDAGKLANQDYFQDVWENAQNESRRVLEMVENISAAVVRPNQDFDAFVAPRGLIGDAVKRNDALKVEFDLSPGEDLPELKVDRRTADRMIDVLLHETGKLNRGEGKVNIAVEGPHAVWGTPGVRVTFRGQGEDWSRPRIDLAGQHPSSDSDDYGIELLSAFFIANHHGGDIQFVTGEDDPRIEVTLPNDPMAAERPPTDPNFLDDLFEMFEIQQLNA